MHINQELRSTKTKGSLRYLIVAISLDQKYLAALDLKLKTPVKPIAIALKDVYEKLDDKEWEVVDYDLPDFLFYPESEIKEKYKNLRDEAKAHLSPLIDDKDTLDHYLFGAPSGIFNNLVKTSKKSKSYIHKRIMQWFLYGSMDNALLPHYIHCGKSHRLPERPVFLDDGTVCLASKPGKKTKYGEPYRGATDWDVKNIEEYSKTIKSGTKIVLSEEYTRFIAKTMTCNFFPDFDIKQEEILPCEISFPRRYMISDRSFKRYLNKIIPKLEWLKKRVGTIAYDKDKKGKPGVAKHGLRAGGQRYEIDATVADIYIKYPYSEDELLSCGRPVIYFVIDTYSSIIVGLHVAFDGPNWNGASQALFNAFQNKVEFCNRWGMEINEEDWPCDHICSEIVWDRGGENTDRNLSSILKGKIGVMIMKLAAYHRGDCKGTVEKKFHTIQSKAIKFEAGRVEKAPVKEAQHASRKPVYEIDEFMRILIKIIINKNNNSIKTESHNFHMEVLKIGYTPRDIWNFFMGQIIHKPQVSNDKRRFALMPEVQATVRDKGVFLHGLYFSSREIEKKLWLDKAKNFGRYKINVRYTDLTTNHIWFYDEENKSFMQLDLQERSEAYKNQIWANVLHRLELRKHDIALLGEKKFSNEVILEMDLTEMDALAKKRNKKLTKSHSKGVEQGIQERKDQVSSVLKNNELSELTSDMSIDSNSPDINETHTTNNVEQDLSDPTVIHSTNQE